MKNILIGIIFFLMPILAGILVNIITELINMEMIMNVVYVMVIISAFKLIKEVIINE